MGFSYCRVLLMSCFGWVVGWSFVGLSCFLVLSQWLNITWCLNCGMVFVRVKRVYGNQYGYLVENFWNGKGTKQKVIGYLGKVLSPERVESESLAGFLRVADVGGYVKESDFRVIVGDLVRLEFRNHGVRVEDFAVDFDGLTVCSKRGKGVVFAMNGGFLCGYTLKSLVEYDHGRDYSGYVLADLLTAAGLLPSQDFFIELYGKFSSGEDVAKKFEFYY